MRAQNRAAKIEASTMTQWTITKDLLAEPGSSTGGNSNAVGLVGPRIKGSYE